MVVGEFGRMRRSTDDGDTWEESSSPTDKSLMAVSFRNKNDGVVVGLEGTILTTMDAVESWEIVATKISDHLFDVTWDGEEWIAVGSDGSLLQGDKNSTSWHNRGLSKQERGWHTKVINTSRKTRGINSL